ncbi:MAG: hypothetical protein WAU07_01135, partial [Microgenomates group bacterium]
MKVTLLTEPALLQSQFINVRCRLLGQKLIHRSIASPFDIKNIKKIVSRRSVDKIERQKIENEAAFSANSENTSSTTRKNTHFTKATNLLLSLVILASVVITGVIFLPNLYYAIFPADVVELVPKESGTPLGGLFAENTTDSQVSDSEENPEPVVEKYIPPINPELPEGDWIVIPRIGVRTELRDTADPEEALQHGVWWVPDWGKAGDTDQPLIAAAHRFGWDWWWQDDYWKYNSFYLLPDTEPGDRVEVISGQRKWIY